MSWSIRSWRFDGGAWPSFSAATLRSPARRSASASDASAMRRSWSRSCGRAAAIAALKCSRDRLASIRSAARAPRMACAAASAPFCSILICRCLGGMGVLLSLRPAAETGGLGVGGQRALGQARLGFEGVIPGWRDVVRRVGVEERGEVLDLAAARPELVLAAAVGAHPALLAEVVALEQRLDAAETRRLEVDGSRQHRRGEDVVDRVNRRVPGDPVLVGAQRLARRP